MSKEELEVLSSLSVPVVKRNDSSSPLFSCCKRVKRWGMPILYNPSEAVKKLGESVEQRYLQSFRIAGFDRHRSQGSASERE